MLIYILLLYLNENSRLGLRKPVAKGKLLNETYYVPCISLHNNLIVVNQQTHNSEFELPTRNYSSIISCCTVLQDKLSPAKQTPKRAVSAINLLSYKYITIILQIM